MSKRIVPVNKFPAPANKKNTTSSPVPPKTKAITKKHDGPFLFMDLPSELRRQILEYTCLVVRPLPNLPEDSLTIYEGHCTIKSEPGRCCGRCKGQCQCPSQQCACYAFSLALFYTCKELSMEARETCFSLNRITILDLSQMTLDKFFKKQPPHLLKLIRELDFYFGNNDLPYADESETLDRDWPELIKFIKENLNVHNLTLSIDASLAYMDWVTTGSSQEDIKSLELPRTYDKITGPLQQLSGLSNLFVYWPCFHKLETEAEKAIMGPEYDAYQHGKTLLKDRAPGYPRGGEAVKSDVGMMGNYDPQD